MYKVVLNKGKKGDSVYNYNTLGLAMRKAKALAALHRTDVKVDGTVVHVDASNWYTR